MPFYVSAEALLADIRLRLEGSGVKSTALVVEGPDDKRLFYHRVSPTAHVVVAGGKTLLRSGLLSMLETDHGRILFLTDCDYDVRNGQLTGGPNVVITAGCDIEADLISLGVLDRLAVEIAPRAVETRGGAAKIGKDVREHAEKLCRALGRIRMASQPLGVDLCLDEWDFGKFWDRKTDAVLSDKLEQTAWSRLKSTGISRDQWHSLISDMPNDGSMCNGKDLVRASQLFFRAFYRMSNKITAEIMAMMLRLALDDQQFDSWSVVHRIRKWEGFYGRDLLSGAGTWKMNNSQSEDCASARETRD